MLSLKIKGGLFLWKIFMWSMWIHLWSWSRRSRQRCRGWNSFWRYPGRLVMSTVRTWKRRICWNRIMHKSIAHHLRRMMSDFFYFPVWSNSFALRIRSSVGGSIPSSGYSIPSSFHLYSPNVWYGSTSTFSTLESVWMNASSFFRYSSLSLLRNQYVTNPHRFIDVT